MLWDSNLAVIIHSPQYWTNNILILSSELPTSESLFLPPSLAEMYTWSHRSWTLEQGRIQQFWRSEPRAASVTAMGRDAARKERLKAEMRTRWGRAKCALEADFWAKRPAHLKWLTSLLPMCYFFPLSLSLVVGTENFRYRKHKGKPGSRGQNLRQQGPAQAREQG